MVNLNVLDSNFYFTFQAIEDGSLEDIEEEEKPLKKRKKKKKGDDDDDVEIGPNGKPKVRHHIMFTTDVG